jgi:hypothetical protein
LFRFCYWPKRKEIGEPHHLKKKKKKSQSVSDTFCYDDLKYTHTRVPGEYKDKKRRDDMNGTKVMKGNSFKRKRKDVEKVWV